jgi:hypothetical protein
VALVTNNPTLVSLWNTLLKNMAGQPVKLVAEYVWGPDRVEAIRFSIPVTRVDMPAETVVVKPPLLPLPDFVRKAVDALAQQRQLGFQLTGDQVQRLTCVLRGLLAPGFDDRFVNFWDMWAYAKLMTDADPKWDLILKRATQWLEPARPSTRDARFIVSALEKMDQAIVRGIMHINQQYVNNAVNPGTAPVHDFILDRQRTPNNVYSCYHP